MAYLISILAAIGPILLALAALITARSASLKNAAEIQKIYKELSSSVTPQLSPNHGTSMYDKAASTISKLDVVLDNQERHDAELGRLNKQVAGLGSNLMEGISQLHAADSVDRKQASIEHERLWAAINNREVIRNVRNENRNGRDED